MHRFIPLLSIFALPAFAGATSTPPATTPTPPPVPSCQVLSYERGTPGWLHVKVSGTSQMPDHLIAAASANASDTVWVQRGQQVSEDGEVKLEGWDLHGQVLVLLALSPDGEALLSRLQQGAASGKAAAQAMLDPKLVRTLCTGVAG